MKNTKNIKELFNNPKQIVIPTIQRDYAQGRESEKEIRNNLLASIFDVLTGKEQKGLHLNYVFGVPAKEDDGSESIHLIDGQQRITTLFLLLCYLSINANKENDCRNKLCYKARETTKLFCEFLADNSECLKHNEGTAISDEIRNHRKFTKKWQNDPSVRGMMNMLDAIDEKAGQFDRNYAVWLNNLRFIRFNFVVLDNYKQEEELYSTMNSTGKQLTKFEIIKSDLLKKCVQCGFTKMDETINNHWIPAFWEFAKMQAPENQLQYAIENHDKFLYNYYTYLVSMLFAEAAPIKEQFVPEEQDKSNWLDVFLSGERATNKWLIKLSVDEFEEKKDFIVFAMDLFEKVFLKNEYRFSEDICYVEDNVFDKTAVQRRCCSQELSDRKVLIYSSLIENKLDELLAACCNGTLNHGPRLILWAYIKYRYNEYYDFVQGKELRDYYSLMRDIYADSWDTETPIYGFSKKPKEYAVIKDVKRFADILDKHENDSTQAIAFWRSNQYLKQILNSPLIRGRSTNLKFVLSADESKQERFLTNLSKLFCQIGSGSFEMMSKINYGILKCRETDSSIEQRRYVPWTIRILQSLFFITSWNDDNHYYTSLLSKLCESDLNESDEANYQYENWQYYFKNYSEYFFTLNRFAAFDTRNGNIEFDITGVYSDGGRGTKHRSHPAFLFAAYCLKNDKITDNLLTEFTNYKEENELTISKNKDSWVISILQNKQPCNYEWKKNCDLIQFIKNIFEGKDPYDPNNYSEQNSEHSQNNAGDSDMAPEHIETVGANEESRIPQDGASSTNEEKPANASLTKVAQVDPATEEIADYRHNKSRNDEWLANEFKRWYSSCAGCNERSILFAFALYYRVNPTELRPLKKSFRKSPNTHCYFDYGKTLGELIREKNAYELGNPVSDFSGMDKETVTDNLARILNEYEKKLGHLDHYEIYSSLLGLKYGKIISAQGQLKAGICKPIVERSKIHEKYGIEATGVAIGVGMGVRSVLKASRIDYDDFIRECKLSDEEFYKY